MKKCLSILIALVLALSAAAALADHPVTGASGLTKQLAGAGGASQSGGFPAHTAAQIGAPAAAAHIKDMRPQAGPVINNARVLNDIVAARYFLELYASFELGESPDGIPDAMGGLWLKYGDDMPDNMGFTASFGWDIHYGGLLKGGFLNVEREGFFPQAADLPLYLIDAFQWVDPDNNYPDVSLFEANTGKQKFTVTLDNGAVYEFKFTPENPIPKL